MSESSELTGLLPTGLLLPHLGFLLGLPHTLDKKLSLGIGAVLSLTAKIYSQISHTTYKEQRTLAFSAGPGSPGLPWKLSPLGTSLHLVRVFIYTHIRTSNQLANPQPESHSEQSTIYDYNGAKQPHDVSLKIHKGFLVQIWQEFRDKGPGPEMPLTSCTAIGRSFSTVCSPVHSLTEQGV